MTMSAVLTCAEPDGACVRRPDPFVCKCTRMHLHTKGMRTHRSPHSHATGAHEVSPGCDAHRRGMNLAPRSRFTDLAVAWVAAVAAMLALGTVVGQLIGGVWPASAWGSLASSTLLLAPVALAIGLAGCWWLTRRRAAVEPLEVLGIGLVALPLMLAGCCIVTS